MRSSTHQKPHVMSHVGLTRQSWGADVIKSRQLVETPVPAERALSESWAFVRSDPVRQARMGVVVKISHSLGIKENQGRTPLVSLKRVLDLD